MPQQPFHVWPDISISGTALSRQMDAQLEQVVVDHHQHLPDMFLIAFHDPGRDVLGQLGVNIGSPVVIKVTTPGSSSPDTLIDGEVTSLEADYDANLSLSIIRGYDKSHRLHRGRRAETYKNVSDSDIVRTVVGRAGLTIKQIDSTSGTFDHVTQANQSDWDFLKARARETNYEMGMDEGKFYYRQPVAASAAPQNGSYRNHSDPLQLVFGVDLVEFRPRVTSAEQVSTVKVRGWDPQQKQAVIGSASPAPPAGIDALPDTSSSLAGSFGSPTYTVVNRPIGKQPEADAAVKGTAETLSSGYAEADGVAQGNPKLKAGATVSVGMVGPKFAGKYTLTNTRHIFDAEGYRTHFTVSGRQDRSLLGLASLGASNGHASAGGAPINGVVVALVTDNNDPNNLARVKLKFPWLDDNHESDWARITQPGAGPDSGMVWMPEVNDEVLVAFEHGDIRRPYVVGSLFNGQDKPKLGSSLFNNGKVVRRGFISRTGHQFIFFDDSSKAGIAIISSDGKYKISMNMTNSEIHIESGGKVTIKSQQDMSFESQANITLSAGQGLSLEAKGSSLDLKGVSATLKSTSPSIAIDNGAAKIELNGPEVNVNSGALQVM